MPGLKEELEAFKAKFAATNDAAVVVAYESGLVGQRPE